MSKGARNRARRNRDTLLYNRELKRVRLKVQRYRKEQASEGATAGAFLDMRDPRSNLWRDLARDTRRRREPVRIKVR